MSHGAKGRTNNKGLSSVLPQSVFGAMRHSSLGTAGEIKVQASWKERGLNLVGLSSQDPEEGAEGGRRPRAGAAAVLNQPKLLLVP